MRGLSVRGARGLTSGGVLGQYVEHGEQAQPWGRNCDDGTGFSRKKYNEIGPSAGEKCGLSAVRQSGRN